MKERAVKDKPTLTSRLEKVMKIAKLTIMPTIKVDLKHIKEFKKKKVRKY